MTKVLPGSFINTNPSEFEKFQQIEIATGRHPKSHANEHKFSSEKEESVIEKSKNHTTSVRKERQDKTLGIGG